MLRLLWPLSISKADLGTLSCFDRNCRHILLAAPSTGGAVSLILSASPWIPATAFWEDRGWTYTLKRKPSFIFRISSVTGISYLLYDLRRGEGLAHGNEFNPSAEFRHFVSAENIRGGIVAPLGEDIRDYGLDQGEQLVG